MGVDVTGPDGKTYSFPDGTDKAAAIRYFKKKGIGAPVRSAPALGGPEFSAAPTAAQKWKNLFTHPLNELEAESHTHPRLPDASIGEMARTDLANAGAGVAGVIRHPVDTAVGILKAGARAGGAGLAYDLATGKPTVYREMFDQFNTKGPEAGAQMIGQAVALDAMGEGLGEAGGKVWDRLTKLGPEGKVNKLAYASGTGTADLVKATLPEVEKVAGQSLPAEPTVGNYLDMVQKAKSTLNGEYANALGPHADDPTPGSPIADRIRSLVTPNMAKTAAGKAEARAILNAAKEFDANWTLGELDAERMDANARLNAYESKSMVDQYATLRKTRSVAIDKAIADGVREVVYPQMDQLAGKPPGYFAGLKKQIGNLMELESKVDKQVKTLRDTSARIKGSPPMERVHVGTSVSTMGRPHGYVAGLKDALFPRDPLKTANKAVQKAFKQPAPRNAARSMPLSALTGTAVVLGNATDDWAGTGAHKGPAPRAPQ